MKLYIYMYINVLMFVRSELKLTICTPSQKWTSRVNMKNIVPGLWICIWWKYGICSILVTLHIHFNSICLYNKIIVEYTIIITKVFTVDPKSWNFLKGFIRNQKFYAWGYSYMSLLIWAPFHDSGFLKCKKFFLFFFAFD